MQQIKRYKIPQIITKGYFTMVLEDSIHIKKLAAYYRLEVAEVISEAWLLRCEFPDLSDALLLKKVSSRCIELVKINGVSARAVDDIGEMGDALFDARLQSKSVLEELIDREDALEYQARIDSLDSLSRARLAAVTGCVNGSEVARRFGHRKQSANRKVAGWCAEAASQSRQLSLVD